MKQKDSTAPEHERSLDALQLIHHLQAGVVVHGPDTAILLANNAASRLLGLSLEQMQGKVAIDPDWCFIREDRTKLPTEEYPVVRVIAALQPLDTQILGINRPNTGDIVWVQVNAFPKLDDRGQLVHAVVTFVDITGLKRAEEQIRRLNEDLQRHAAELERRVAERTAELEVARDHARESDRLKSAFLATMSHELRTPLNSIIGFTGIILMEMVGPLNEEQKKQLGIVRANAHHLLELINDILDLSRIESGQFEITRNLVDMENTIEKVLEKMTPLAGKKGLELTAVIAPPVGQVLGDRRRVEQILINLIGNAIKFTEEGEVRIESKAEGRWLVTRVLDTGIGIKPEDQEMLFRPFRQVDTRLSRQYEGTGLGLSISRLLVEAMGGEIHVDSEFGKGSAFTFTLPLTLPSGPAE
ncbi:MAG: ATP-binding protein [Candidatus Eremiobacteraeota bacterium]|nr:ATP-binding protein [Candidatus Eremiobacteraeota bacterium]